MRREICASIFCPCQLLRERSPQFANRQTAPPDRRMAFSRASVDHQHAKSERVPSTQRSLAALCRSQPPSGQPHHPLTCFVCRERKRRNSFWRGSGRELRRLGWIEKRTATARDWVRGSTAEAKADDPVMAMTGFNNQYKRVFDELLLSG